MSKSRSDDAPRWDWAALLAEVRDLDAPLTDEQKRLWQLGQYDGEANAWGADYVAALQAAIEGRKPGRLLDLLECEVPIPPMLLPALAAAMRMLLDRSVRGRPARFTVQHDEAIRVEFDLRTQPPSPENLDAVIQEIADRWDVDARSIKRSLNRTKR